MTSCAESPGIDDMEIAPGYTVADWKALDLSGDDAGQWFRAIKIFETRIRRRFIEPVDVLIAHEIGQERGTFGFAILAIDCLLVETLQGFREGCIKHHGKAEKGDRSRSEELIVTFLGERMNSWFDANAAVKFYKHCRCAIHHNGQTDGDFRVRCRGELIVFDGDRVTVNRTAFHDAIKRVFDAYLAELADPANSGLRKNFRTKMNAICGITENGTT